MVYSEGPKKGWSKKFPRFPLIRKLQSTTHPANPYLQFLPRFKLERFQRSAFKSNRNPENSSGNRSKNPISYSYIIPGGEEKRKRDPWKQQPRCPRCSRCESVSTIRSEKWESRAPVTSLDAFTSVDVYGARD